MNVQTPTKTKTEKKMETSEKVHAQKYIDATNLIVGRMASLVAQDLLRGHSITIANAENAVFTGNPVLLTQLWQTRLDLRPKGNPEKGPRFHKMPDRIIREIIEGMLPSRRERGRAALRRLKVYIGTPTPLQNKTFSSLEKAHNHKTKGITTVKALAQKLGYNLLKG